MPMLIQLIVAAAAALFVIKSLIDLAPSVGKCGTAIFRFFFGPPKPRPNLPEDARRIAYHEAGHTVFQWFDPELPIVRHVTIAPNRTSAGHMQPEKARSNFPLPADYRAVIACSLSGRVAEELADLGPSYGIIKDLEDITDMARAMVTQLGMSERVGLIRVDVETCSEEMLRVVEEEIVKISAEAYVVAKNRLGQYRVQLELVAEALLKHVTLDTVDLVKLLGQRPLPAN